MRVHCTHKICMQFKMNTYINMIYYLKFVFISYTYYTMYVSTYVTVFGKTNRLARKSIVVYVLK